MLSNVQVESYYVSGCDRSWVAPAISGGGFEQLLIYDSAVYATRLSACSGRAIGTNGLNTDIPFVLVERSVIEGSTTDDDDGLDGALPSGDGILAPGSLVVLLDSKVKGGDGGEFGSAPWDAEPCAQWMYDSARGGHGVVARRVFLSGSEVAGGDGGSYNAPLYEGGPRGTCPGSTPGTPIVSEVRAVTLASNLVLLEQPRRGSSFRLQYSGSAPVLLFWSSDWTVPTTIGIPGFVFLGGSPRSLGTVVPGKRSFAVPDLPALTGRELVFQAVTPTEGFSRPVGGLVR